MIAKDLKQDKKATAPAMAATQMTDSEMDRVTAGGMIVDTFGTGPVYTHSSNGFQGNGNHAASCSNCGL